MSAAESIVVHGLVCHRDVDTALLCLGSLLKFSSQSLQLVIHDDGSLTEEDLEKIEEELRNTRVVSREEGDELADRLLQKQPNCRKFRSENVLGLKLFDTALLSEQYIAYCDSDVLFFRPFTNLFEFPDSQTSALFMIDYQNAYALSPWHLCGLGSLRLISKVNSGLMFVKSEVFDPEFLESLLSDQHLAEEFKRVPYWAEQTCWAALAYRASCRLWSPDQIAVINPYFSEDTNRLIAGHFTSPLRHLIPSTISSNAPALKGESSLMKTIPSVKLTPLRFVASTIENRLVNLGRKLRRLVPIS